jgi:preprotein translocase subunit SecY
VKIMEYTRYVTVGLCLVQGFGWLAYLGQANLIYPQYMNNPLWWVMGIAVLTAGCVFLMWIGEQIDKHGIGNGASMIIMAGILSSMPGAINTVYNSFEPGEQGRLGWMGLLSLVAMLSAASRSSRPSTRVAARSTAVRRAISRCVSTTAASCPSSSPAR